MFVLNWSSLKFIVTCSGTWSILLGSQSKLGKLYWFLCLSTEDSVHIFSIAKEEFMIIWNKLITFYQKRKKDLGKSYLFTYYFRFLLCNFYKSCFFFDNNNPLIFKISTSRAKTQGWVINNLINVKIPPNYLKILTLLLLACFFTLTT